MNIRALLTEKVQQAMLAAGIPADCPASVAASTRPESGDFQANGAIAAAKTLKANPRELATRILSHLDLAGIAADVSIAGPGFINLQLADGFVAQALTRVSGDALLGAEPAKPADTVVIDYSGPNLAKEMHVGHLRSTIIGDAMARVLAFLGHRVIRQNHMGDWGTQFGMLIAELEDQLGAHQAPELALADLEDFYRQAKRHFDADPVFAERARDYVVRLQAGDVHCRTLWQRFIDISTTHSEAIYRALNVSLSSADSMPESAYNDDLAAVLADLRAQGLAVESEGAQVVFLPELADRHGDPSPVIVQKSDGGYLYATTDLAALRYRYRTLGADRILYFIDARQSLHMQQVFAIARKAGFVPDNIRLEHHGFGTMMGEDGKPFKTRSGDTVKLAELLTEAVERAEQVIAVKDPDLGAAERRDVARKVGIGAVKYADLSKTRTHDYLFNWNAMLGLEGNTAPYLQYAYSRIRSIFRKAGLDSERLNGDITIANPAEKALALHLLRFGEVLHHVADDAYPHILCNYLYDLASAYMHFYEHCPVLKDGVDTATRKSRLLICQLTGDILAKGLALLGIDTMERM